MTLDAVLRDIVGLPPAREAPDPLALADRDVANLVLDMNAAVNRAGSAEDALRVHLHLEAWRKALATVELAALVRANGFLTGKD